MLALPRSSLQEVRARPWHFGIEVVKGPAWEASGNGNEQLGDAALVHAVLMEPDYQTLLSWSCSCLTILWAPPLLNPLGGWSPGRSVVVEVHITGRERMCYYYKLFDEDACDIDLKLPHIPVLPPLGGWATVWRRFLFVSVSLQLQHLDDAGAKYMLLEMITREVEAWNNELCLDFCIALNLHATGSIEAKRQIVTWSRRCITQRYTSLAKQLDARVYQLRPLLVLDYIVRRR